MNDIQSDRKLLPFPAELRLMIYRNVVKKTYLALREICDYRGEIRKPFIASANLGILRVSKATSAEALKLLYEESVFLFKFDIMLRLERYARYHSLVPLMSNVSFDIPATPLNKPSTSTLISENMWSFTGTRHLHNTMRIKFKDCDGDTHDCDHMKDLRGFRKLVVEFESLPFPGSDKPMSESERAQAVSQCQSQCEKGKIARLRKTFEPAYGPAVQGAVHSDSTYTCYLEFYPRQHLAKELMAKAGKILKEAARLSAGERAAVALLEMVETLKIL